MSDHRRQPRRAPDRWWPPLLLCMMLIGTTLLAAPATRQDALGSGRALDRNLAMGSGGYNRRVNSSRYVGQGRYTAGNSKPLFTVQANGSMWYTPHNAFNPRSRYRATGYRDNRYSNANLRRFRYHSH